MCADVAEEASGVLLALPAGGCCGADEVSGVPLLAAATVSDVDPLLVRWVNVRIVAR